MKNYKYLTLYKNETMSMYKWGVFFCLMVIFTNTTSAQIQKCEHINNEDPLLYKLSCNDDFNILQGEPLSNNYAQVEAIKVVYDLKNEQLYFINSKQYKFHFDFCSNFLHYNKDLSYFNFTEYGEGKSRQYILANLNHYKTSDIYTVEFFSDDKVSEFLITKLYDQVKYHVFFSDQLYLVDNANMQGKLTHISPKYIVSIDLLYGKQTYQPMVLETSYGYLQKVDKKSFNSHVFNKDDIILTDFLPNDIPFCQGIITSEFQTPLSHINVLSQNRKTPNCAYKYVWDNTYVNSFIGKLVRFEVLQDTFLLREASIEEASKFWKEKNNSYTKILNCNLKETRLLDVKYIHFSSVNTFGGKAANFGEIEKINLDNNSKIPIPEAAFGIPFYYYHKHITQNNLQTQIDFIINNDTIYSNRTRLSYYLEILQDSIKSKPLDPIFYAQLISKLKSYPNYTDFRFRSSTNAEDIEGFTGAGLYTSKTGSIVDTTKSIEKAIKKVWASLWTLRAFEERMYAKIDQHNLAMGILVHRAFGTEEANGVAITKDLYRKDYPAFTINIQKGENSVVLPVNKETPEQFMIKFTSYTTGTDDIALDYISHSSLNDHKELMNIQEIRLLTSYLTAIRNHFYFKMYDYYDTVDLNNFGMDIEFKLDKGTRKIYIKQARPY